MPSLKIIFAGTPAFAAVALEKLIHSSHQVIAVYTQPDKPAGRGLKLAESPVKLLAKQHDLPIFQPATLKTAEAAAQLKALNADVMVVAAYGLILPASILGTPRLGCINIHPSLLPRWRGAAPIQRTIFYGDRESGVTIMQMDEGLDTGPLLLQRPYTLKENETSASLLQVMSGLGAEALIETLNLLAENKLFPTPQDNARATHAAKMTKEEAEIDWSQPAKELENKIRAFNPWPVAYTSFQQDILRVWMAKAIDEKTKVKVGAIVRADKSGIDIATGDGVLRLLEVQLPGKKAMSAADFYNAKHAMLVSGKTFS